MGQWLKPKAGGQPVYIPDDAVGKAVASGRYEAPDADATGVVADPSTGTAYEVPASELGAAQEATGYAPESEAGARSAERSARLEGEHGGLLGQGLTALEQGLDSATFGLSGAIADATLGGEYAGNRRERLEVNEEGSLVGTIGGAVLPGLLTGGSGGVGAVARATPAGAAGRAGARIAEKLGGGVIGSTAGFGVEGALFGAGAAAQELSRSEDPLTLERAASVLKTNVLFGAGVGALAGGGGAAASKLAGKGIEKGREFLEKVRTRAGVADDLVGKDATALRAAEETEKTVLQAAREEAKGAVADQIANYHSAREEANVFLVAEGEAKKILTGSKGAIRRQLDNPTGLRRNPKRALDALEREETALRRVAAEADNTVAKLAEEDGRLSQVLAKRVEAAAGQVDSFVELDGKLARRYADWSGTKMTKGEKVLTVTPEDAGRFQAALDAGEVHGMRAQSLQKVDGLLEHNLALQKRIGELDAPLTSPRLDAIADARTALSTPKSAVEKGLTGYAMGAVSGFLPGGPIGAIAAMVAPGVVRKTADLVLGRLAKASVEAAAGTGKAVETLMAGGKAVGRAAPVAASRVLSEHSFGGAPVQAAKVGRKPSALKLYQQREKELLDMVAVGPSGKIEMRPQSRAELGEKLLGVRAVAPVLADRIETVAARKVEFLADKLPKRPDSDGRFGPSRWRPSDMAVAKWARYVDAVENPAGVEDRLARGVVTPGDAEAYKAIYPERYADLQRRIAEQLPQLRQTLPYERQVNLSIFTGMPVASAFQPRTMRRLQGNFMAEPGSEGGTQAPRAMPNFGSQGSTKSQEQTPSQRRESE